jgi:N-methylhydantoinase B
MDGGRHGASSEKVITRTDGSEVRLPSKVEEFPVRAGDRLRFATAGAGGMGDPLTREPARVAHDVRSRLVTVEAARSEYGVVVSADGQVDDAATEGLRAELRAGRDDLPQFEFGPVPPVEELRRRIAEERREFDGRMAREAAQDQ